MTTKPSDSKGFWGAVTRYGHGETETSAGLRVTPSVTDTESDPLLDAYKRVVRYILSIHAGFRTPTGRPKKPPAFIAVTLCAEENEYGLTDARQAKGRRFACNTCYSFAPTVWAEGVTPTREDQEQEWADWAAKQTPRSETSKVRKRLREIGVIT